MPAAKNDAGKIDWLLTHGVERVLPSADALRERLSQGAPLTIYNGIDPTGPTLHLGHLLTLKKLAEFQQLGHKIILLIGDFTAMIGDPTDKSATRKQLTRDEVLANCKLYKEQASRVLKFEGPNAAEMRFNSEWLAKMSFAEVIELASHFTVQQMAERDTFQKRLRWDWRCPTCKQISPSRIQFANEIAYKTATLTGNTNQCPHCNKVVPFEKADIIPAKPVYLHEFLYPLMQGFDSVAMDVDVEVGGNDQTFNMLAGRTLLKEIRKKEKFVLATRLLTDPTGKKMGKSEGNMVALTDTPQDMYGKLMSWPDGMIVPGFELCTDASPDEIKRITQAIKTGENPMTFKRTLAQRVVGWLTSPAQAEQAAEEFTRVHREHERPAEIPVIRISGLRVLPLQDALVSAKLVQSKSEGRRQIEQGGIKVDDHLVTDPKAVIEIADTGTVIQKGKRHFVKLVP